MLILSLTYIHLHMVFYRSKGIIALWINSWYILVSASRKTIFTNTLVIMGFGTWKIQKQNSELVQMNTSLLISILSVWLVSVYSGAEFYLCNQKCLKIRWCEILDVLMSIKKHPFNLPVISVEPGFMLALLPSFMMTVSHSHWVCRKHAGVGKQHGWGLWPPLKNKLLLSSGLVCSNTREASLLLVPYLKTAPSIKSCCVYLDIYPDTRWGVLPLRRCFPSHTGISVSFMLLCCRSTATK